MSTEPVLHLGLTLGALEIGTLISSVFLGITTVQVYNYYNANFKDPFWIRLLVVAVWTMETVHTVFIWIYLYNLTVTEYGNPAALADSPWTLSMSSVFDGLIGGIVQSYFAYRVYVLGKNLILPIVSWTLSALQLSTCLAIAILGARMSFGEFAARFSWVVTTTLASNVSVDILNTIGLCYFLYIQRSENKVRRTRATIDRLIAWTLETALITSIAAILMLALFLNTPGTTLWISITLFYAKLYSNCFLASLNGRAILRRSQGLTVNSSTIAPSTGVLEVSVTQNTLAMSDLSASRKGYGDIDDDMPRKYRQENGYPNHNAV